jgi:cytochrome b6-f complex iron-sulfur subunit
MVMKSDPARALPQPKWRFDPDSGAGKVGTARPSIRELARPANLSDHQTLRRRTLLRRDLLSGLGVLGLGGIVQLLDYVNPRDVTGFGGVITIPAPLVPKPGQDPVHVLQGKVWLVNLNPGEGVPESFRDIAPPSAKGGLLALYQRCVHLGCTVPWRADFEFGGVTGWFRCPCHGSTYTKGGIRVFGPATRSMDTFQITSVTANGVSIDTTRISLGSLNDPQQTPGRAVPPGPFA